MAVCTFFGHRDCYELDRLVLQEAIENLIRQGVEQFYVGNQGNFDTMVHNCLKDLKKKYLRIRFSVVLAYLPVAQKEDADLSDTIYPEIEGHQKFAIDRRNRWMLKQASHCICYINHTWGGAYKFARMAYRRGLQTVNLGQAKLDEK